MRALIVIVAFSSLLARVAFARVGETVKQVEAQYGKPVKVFEEHGNQRKVAYRYRGVVAIVAYAGGISQSEYFARQGKSRLSDAEVQQLLVISLAPGTRWHYMSEHGGAPMWIRSDGKAAAGLDPDNSLQVLAANVGRP